MTTCAIVSFRLGLTDGVSAVARSWARALADIGFTMVTVAGEGPVDRPVSGLAIDAPEPPPAGEIEDALVDADLVIVENLCTIPMNPRATHVVAEALRGRPAVLHHHDPPWQREQYAHVTTFPPNDPAWRHVTISRVTETQMAMRGISARTIYNGFDIRSRGNRSMMREMADVTDDERLIIHPVRGIARKDIPAALAFCERLQATYWITGPAEEGYGPVLARLLHHFPGRVIHQPVDDPADLYAAADAVVFPSTWEGFGNPPIEASLSRRPVAVGPYAVGQELRSLGFRWFDTDDPPALRRWIDEPDDELLDHNHEVAASHFSLEAMTTNLRQFLDEAGWLP